MGERIEAPKRQITVEHLTTSLAHIENWCRAVRDALDSIPDKESIRFPENVGDTPLFAQDVSHQTVKECPPPEPDDSGKDHDVN